MKPIFKFSILLMVMFACHRDKVNYLGPAYISAPEGFAVISFKATPPSVDFTTDSIVFNATFTHNVTWVLNITGQKSGATHQIHGISNGLNNIVWRGNHDGIAFFRAGETVTTILSFFGTSLTSSTNVNIIKAPDYTTCGQFAPYGDFEVPAQIYSGVTWHEFNKPNPIPNVTQGVDSMAIDYNGNIVPSIQGNNYYFIKGLGNQAFFVSGIQFDNGSPLLPVLPANPDNVWVNMYIYGTGNANTQVEIEYQEADAQDKSDPIKYNRSPNTYKGTDDDAFVARIVLDHKGWKLFSFKYSSLTPSLNALFGGSGNKFHEPERLMSFDLVLIKKSNANSPVEVYFDYPIITVGGPFKPCK